MRKILGLTLSLVVLLAGTGCVAVSAKSNRFGSDLDAVVVNDRIYVVNKITGCVKEINVDKAQPFVPDTTEGAATD
jgi:multidrug resistance efflux pump